MQSIEKISLDIYWALKSLVAGYYQNTLNSSFVFSNTFFAL